MGMQQLLGKTAAILSLVLFAAIIVEINFLFRLGDRKTAKSTITPTPPSAYSYWLSKTPLLDSSQKTDVSTGTIAEIDTKGGTSTVGGKTYPYALKIVLAKNSHTFTYLYDGIDLTSMTFYDEKNNVVKPAAFKIGDIIKITEKTNLLGSGHTLLQVEIKKLSQI